MTVRVCKHIKNIKVEKVYYILLELLEYTKKKKCNKPTKRDYKYIIEVPE